ncbi:hypothetical protein [Rhodoplanes serenus]|uniref:hypothetical protein n=1 Tax=Rhodoplanes serenus TaxID=200615 RepID=UPI0011B94A95|nr:hypothetical protein [Rhodoplanes serenus]
MRSPGWLVKVGLAIVIGLVAGWFRATTVAETEPARPAIRADAVEYYLSAYNLVHLGIYSRSPGSLANPPRPVVPDGYRPPGLPLMIAPFMAMWPDHDGILSRVQVVNVVLGAGTAMATFAAAAAVLPLTAATAVGLAVAASPHLVAFSVYMLTETPAAFLVALVLAVAALGVPGGGPWRRMLFFLALGALIGLLALFRPIFLAFAPVAGLAFLGRRQVLWAMLFVSLGAAGVVSPWLIRNAVSVPANSGDADLVATTVLDGSYRGYRYNDDPKTFPYPRFADPNFEAARKSLGLAWPQVRDRIAADPAGMIAWYLLEKPAFLLQWSNVDGVGDVFVYAVERTPFRSDLVFRAVHDIYEIAHPVVLLLAGLAAVAVWTPLVRFAGPPDRRHVVRLASLLLVFLVVAHIPFFTATRYAVPVFPALYLLAVVPLVIIARGLAAWARGSAAMPPA